MKKGIISSTRTTDSQFIEDRYLEDLTKIDGYRITHPIDMSVLDIQKGKRGFGQLECNHIRTGC